jgi:hypothetical protein
MHGTRKAAGLDFGPQANVDGMPYDFRWHNHRLKPVELRWYDYWLNGIENGLMEEQPVQIFVMRPNHWRNEREWPLSRAGKGDKVLPACTARGTLSRYGDGYVERCATLQRSGPQSRLRPSDSDSHLRGHRDLTGIRYSGHGWTQGSEGDRKQGRRSGLCERASTKRPGSNWQTPCHALFFASFLGRGIFYSLESTNALIFEWYCLALAPRSSHQRVRHNIATNPMGPPPSICDLG